VAATTTIAEHSMTLGRPLSQYSPSIRIEYTRTNAQVRPLALSNQQEVIVQQSW